MSVLSDVIANAKTLTLIAPGFITVPESLRLLALFLKAKEIGVDVKVIVLGEQYKWFTKALESQKISYETKITGRSAYVLEISGGKDKVKSVKVDVENGKLLLYLEPKNGEVTKQDITFADSKLKTDVAFIFGGYTFVADALKHIDSSSKIFTFKEFYMSYDNITNIDVAQFDKFVLTKNIVEANSDIQKYFLLDVYNDLLLYFLKGNSSVDLALVREAMTNQVLSWQNALDPKALQNWQIINGYVLGKLEYTKDDFVPAAPMWADMAFLTATNVSKSVVTLIRTGDYVYVRIVSPDVLPPSLAKYNMLVRNHIAEGILNVDNLAGFQVALDSALNVTNGVKTSKIAKSGLNQKDANGNKESLVDNKSNLITAEEFGKQIELDSIANETKTSSGNNEENIETTTKRVEQKRMFENKDNDKDGATNTQSVKSEETIDDANVTSDVTKSTNGEQVTLDGPVIEIPKDIKSGDELANGPVKVQKASTRVKKATKAKRAKIKTENNNSPTDDVDVEESLDLAEIAKKIRETLGS